MLYEADVVVIGAGALGSSVAFHLAARGDRRVAIVEKFEAASQTSPRAAGLTQQISLTEARARIGVRACEKIARFAEETGEPMAFTVSGSLKLARTDEHAAQLGAELAHAREWGVRLASVEPAELPRLCPWVSPRGVLAATYNPDDLYLEPVQIPRGYARAAVKRGAALFERTAVNGLLVERGCAAGVATARGEVRAPVVVDAAGAWSRAVAAGSAAPLGVVPTRHQLLITEPLAEVRPEHPIVRVIDPNVYVRPDRGGLMLGGYEPDPRTYVSERLGDDFQIRDLELDLAVLRRLADAVREQLPIFQDVLARGAIQEHRGGLPTMSPDGAFLVGPVDAVPGLYVSTGCNVGGLSTAPALGEALAELICTGRSALDLSPFKPDRFDVELVSSERLEAECRRQYAFKYWAKLGVAAAER
ncbi:MAG TPA: FAD-binding oxidoreductase [Chloroflexota bacterium]|nr:FAD-binding oxidoreductase [Chloroflexota bacterium]